MSRFCRWVVGFSCVYLHREWSPVGSRASPRWAHTGGGRGFSHTHTHTHTRTHTHTLRERKSAISTSWIRENSVDIIQPAACYDHKGKGQLERARCRGACTVQGGVHGAGLSLAGVDGETAPLLSPSTAGLGTISHTHTHTQDKHPHTHTVLESPGMSHGLLQQHPHMLDAFSVKLPNLSDLISTTSYLRPHLSDLINMTSTHCLTPPLPSF